MPEKRVVVENAAVDAPIGNISQMVKVPEPYDAQLNVEINKLRRALFNMVEMGMDSQKHESAKREIRDRTRDTFKVIREMVLDLTESR